MALRRRARRGPPWIPPEPLLFAQAMLLYSWWALFEIGAGGDDGLTPMGLAWIHAVVLGWLTTTALAFLIHILPQFTDVSWRHERLARASLWGFQAGAATIVAGFAAWIPRLVAAGGAIVVVSVATLLVPFFATVAVALRTGDRATRAVARALAIMISIFAITVALGFTLSIGINLGLAFVVLWAPIHAMLGLVGWQALLVAGVSVRTYGRLLRRANRRRSHVATSSLVIAGLVVWIAGRLTHAFPLEAGGDALIVAGAVINLVSTLLLLHGKGNPRRLPREFIAASTFWLAVALCYGLASYSGPQASAAFLFVLLIGYVGQNVNAHLMHVGIRLVATLVIGEDDETQPASLLDRRVGLVSLVLFQAAVACGAAGLTISSGILVEVAAVSGFLGTMAILANVVLAARAARRLAPG